MNNKEPMRDYKNSDNILTNAMFEKKYYSKRNCKQNWNISADRQQVH